METKKTPMELLKEFAPEFAQHQMNDKTLLFENEKYQAVPKKYKLLAGIAASIAGECRPCLDYHFMTGIETGCTIDQIKEAIELGKMINQRPTKDIYDQAEKLIVNINKP